MKKTFLFSAFFAWAAMAFSQNPVTISFQPDGIDGEDATILEFHNVAGENCTHRGATQPPSNTNYGTDPEFYFSAWTYNGGGCPRGTARGLIRFPQLGSLPPNTIIESATLILRGPATTIGWGNSFYPNSPLPNNSPNLGWVKRVLPGTANAWTENGVTWATQPAVDANAANWVSIPATGQRWGWTQSMDVTDMVADIVAELQANPNANNGFMLTLQNETHYKSQIYASSDHQDASLRPELIITYRECHSGFSYRVTSDQPSAYTFTAGDPNLSFYNWTVDGNYAGNTSTLNYNFPYVWSGTNTHKVCLKATAPNGSECERCLEVCGSAYVKNGGVTYGGNPTGCNPLFTYRTATPNNHNYTFSAVDPTLNSYTWRINNAVVGTGPNLNYTFPAIGNYEVMLTVTNNGNNNSCFSYLKDFCVTPIYLYSEGKSEKSRSGEPVSSETAPRGDNPVIAGLEKKVMISPNPAKDSWDIDFRVSEAGKVVIRLLDLAGKQVKHITINGNKGDNRYKMPVSDLASGVYIMEIKGAEINSKLKAIKQ